jgi:hypothetical protein
MRPELLPLLRRRSVILVVRGQVLVGGVVILVLVLFLFLVLVLVMVRVRS